MQEPQSNVGFREVEGSEVVFSQSPTAPCPCGSNRPAAECCLTPAGLYRAPVNTSPKPSRTGLSVDKCYASCLGDCGGSLSREHYISESILRDLNQGKQLAVKGFPWLENPNEFKSLSPAALTARILCERHNSALSPLDTVAGSLFTEILSPDAPRLRLFNGHDIERWLLKVLCGITVSRNHGGGPAVIPHELISILFSGSDFVGARGLYICRDAGHRFMRGREVSCQTITRSTGEVSGIGVHVGGIECILSLSGFASRRFDGRQFVHRPLELKFGDHSIGFSWKGDADRGTISFLTAPHES